MPFQDMIRWTKEITNENGEKVIQSGHCQDKKDVPEGTTVVKPQVPAEPHKE